MLRKWGQDKCVAERVNMRLTIKDDAPSTNRAVKSSIVQFTVPINSSKTEKKGGWGEIPAGKHLKNLFCPPSFKKDVPRKL